MIKIGTKDWIEYNAQLALYGEFWGSKMTSTVEGFYDWLAAGKPKLAAKLHVKHV